ncbi:hypothetical protein H206_06158 [Candidatus Electrothrix aarhusensis]|uniref:Uncharacterized protein n=1 Tax=Candidatus Electrothrix aarhusensis TaxID=1859131 RepID=A0A3S3QL94_9BACT|nr:hypothetical protein H206_06158 [Candidatus Electrothrix aarhusensis]
MRCLKSLRTENTKRDVDENETAKKRRRKICLGC